MKYLEMILKKLSSKNQEDLQLCPYRGIEHKLDRYQISQMNNE